MSLPHLRPLCRPVLPQHFLAVHLTRLIPGKLSAPLSPLVATDPKKHLLTPIIATLPKNPLPQVLCLPHIQDPPGVLSTSQPSPVATVQNDSRIYPLCFHILAHSFPARQDLISFLLNALRTLLQCMGVWGRVSFFFWSSLAGRACGDSFLPPVTSHESPITATGPIAPSGARCHNGPCRGKRPGNSCALSGV